MTQFLAGWPVFLHTEKNNNLFCAAILGWVETNILVNVSSILTWMEFWRALYAGPLLKALKLVPCFYLTFSPHGTRHHSFEITAMNVQPFDVQRVISPQRENVYESWPLSLFLVARLFQLAQFLTYQLTGSHTIFYWSNPWPTINIRPHIMHFRRLVFSYTE